jgi:predicted metal-dependent hydrolase
MNCEKDLPPEALAGIQLFNKGDFFKAHEELEIAWRAEKNDYRSLYQGILQLGVGYHHLQRGNVIGAIRLFTRAESTLENIPENCQGINVNAIREQIKEAKSLVERYQIDPSMILYLPLNKIIPD